MEEIWSRVETSQHRWVDLRYRSSLSQRELSTVKRRSLSRAANTQNTKVGYGIKSSSSKARAPNRPRFSQNERGNGVPDRASEPTDEVKQQSECLPRDLLPEWQPAKALGARREHHQTAVIWPVACVDETGSKLRSLQQVQELVSQQPVGTGRKPNNPDLYVQYATTAQRQYQVQWRSETRQAIVNGGSIAALPIVRWGRRNCDI